MIEIFVSYATLQKQVEIPLIVEENCTIALAIARSKIQQQFPDISLANIAVGIYGKRKTLDTIVSAGDRVEIYRALTIDPMELRRLKAKMSR